jgi:hypothetical protein
MSPRQRPILIFLRGVVDTCTFAALFGGLRSPGDPKRFSGSLNVEECIAMGDFAAAEARAKELATEYRYATAGSAVGFAGGVSALGGYVYLVMKGHSHIAVELLGSCLAALVGAAYKSRSNSK